MAELLHLKQKVTLRDSKAICEVDDFIGAGGQGEVYNARVGNHHVALKWYFTRWLDVDPGQEERLERAIKMGEPDERFIWPIELASEEGVSNFGYIMPLREPRFKGIGDMMVGKFSPPFSVRATAGFHLADAFLNLHTKGLCYRDISFGNVFLDPDNGDVLIPDNDNVDIDGQPGVIGGTPRFMAPEIIIGEEQPSSHTDRYSLAVLLFYMFMMHHPLEGKKELSIHCFDLPAQQWLYGHEPLFIFDPDDSSNEPDPVEQMTPLIYWPLYPKYLRDLFIHSFSEGIRDPQNGRVTETQWREAMAKLRDSVMYCFNCGRQNIYDLSMVQTGNTFTCWKCNREMRLPPRMSIDKNVVILNHDTELFPHHIRSSGYDFSEPTAAVNQHPEDPKIWGLKNLTDEKWVVGLTSGEMLEVEPGKSARLSDGITINFGQKEGRIRI